MFHKVSRAYEVLSDEGKRQTYDLEGIEGLEREEKGHDHSNSPFDSFFGGGGRPRGKDGNVQLSVSLEELYNGNTREVHYKRNVVCRKCRGTGAKDGKTKKCKQCGGQGVVLVEQQMGPGFTVQMQQPCPKCGGKGKVVKKKCPICGGHKVVQEDKELVIDIEKGMPSNHEIVFEKAADQQPGIIPGNVIFHLHQTPHHTFRRSGNDLYYDITITLEEALLGYKRYITHLDGRKVELSSDEVIKPFETKIYSGEGMPHHNVPSQHGDLHVIHNIEFPSKLSASQRELVARIFPE